jgi:methylenetetrahydrofolate--tRNA-(uracil-5-)-methyltransferase
MGVSALRRFIFGFGLTAAPVNYLVLRWPDLPFNCGALDMAEIVNVIGAGLAGCEASCLLSGLGIKVRLWDMKPFKYTEAHTSANFAELVCSNSLKSEMLNSASGVLKREMKLLGSVLLQAADKTRVPAGKALAVDRENFSAWISARIKADPNIQIISQEVSELQPGEPNIICSGPLSSEPMARLLSGMSGSGNMYFYDAIAPIVEADSIDMSSAFWADRYGEGEGDYLNCPLSDSEYDRFYDALREADRVGRREFEDAKHFESCMPVEELASRGKNTLTFGPMRPVGLIDPSTQKRPFAVVQLRKEDVLGRYLNLVGFQTRLRQPEQKRVFGLIPALENAVFSRYGSIHRNTFVNAPQCLHQDLSFKSNPVCYLAGQLTGVEGYLESAAMGQYAALSVACRLKGISLPQPGPTTALGALLNHLQTDKGSKFQPSNVNFGIFESLQKRYPKKQRGWFYGERAEADFKAWLDHLPQSIKPAAVY